MVKKIGLLFHPKLEKSKRLCQELRPQIEEMGLSVWSGSAWDEEAIKRRIADLDLVVTLGGDGTLMRVARIAGPHRVPLLGVRIGRLGFLAEAEPEEVMGKLSSLLQGQYRLEERMMLHVELFREEGALSAYEALNDVVIGRGSIARAVRLATYIDGEHLTTYVADGMIVATPTGSTAYSLAAGGPIVDPQMQNILVTPLAPHLTTSRALVLPRQSVVKVQVFTHHHATLTVDGQIEVGLQDADTVVVTASDHSAQLVRIQPEAYFYRTLMERLNKRSP